MHKRLLIVLFTVLSLVLVTVPLVSPSSASAASLSSQRAHSAAQAATSTNLVQDGGFENQTTSTVSAPWSTVGPGSEGIDLSKGFSHSGLNNAWLRNSNTSWNAIVQVVPVQPNTNYTLTGWIMNNFGQNVGYLGAYASNGSTILQQTSYDALPFYTNQIVDFNSGSNSTIEIFAGFTGQGSDYWMRLDDVSLAPSVFAPQSTFFSTAQEESYSTYTMAGNGDLWPSCWSNDGNLYTSNGDGTGFGSVNTDLVVSRISGTPPNLSGTTLATNVGSDWSGSAYNRKPTGMLCVNGTIYLAFQNLQMGTFNSAPVASIAESTDHGVTWTWDTSGPMFSNGLFTTIFFLDFGQNYGNAIDGYVYVYGLDGNWRGQQDLYLGRVPNNQVMTRSSWQFYTGTDGSGNATWSSDIIAKVPVLEDDRTLYQQTFGNFCCANSPVIAQGGVTYDAPLHRYIFASWSYATQEFYEAPSPWGPWSNFLSKDFGPAAGTQNLGQYGTNIPSKFISADGKSMYVQSNIICCNGQFYTYSLRKLDVSPYTSTTPGNGISNTSNLAQTGNGTTAISKSTHFGTLSGANFSDSLNDGNLTQDEDDWDQEVKPLSWWGYTWNQAYNINKVVYTTGNMFSDGGWFGSGLTVQVRQNFQWVNVSSLSVAPAYPYSSSAGTNMTYTFTFANTWGDGVRIIGAPGGTSHFTSIAELAVYYSNGGGTAVEPAAPGAAAAPTSIPTTKWWITTGSNAPGYRGGWTQVGTLNAGVNYVYCKSWGAEVSDSSGNYNHYWLWTDLDTGGSGWVSAYYLSLWGNDQALDNNGNVIPDCPTT